MNKVILIGNLGADPEHRTTAGGKAVAELRLATNEGANKVEWHRVVCFEKRAELVRHLAKGSRIALEGRIQTRSWEDKQGQKRYTTEIIADRIEFLSGKREEPEADDGDEDSIPL